MENARIKLTVNGNEEVFVNLDDNQASRDFLEMLPLTLTFDDFNNTEKIATLPNELRYRRTTFWLYSKNRRFLHIMHLGEIYQYFIKILGIQIHCIN